MRFFKDKTVFITGASRGIGKAIGLRLGSEGANIVVAAKTDQPHPKLQGTIHTAAAEIIDAGGRALPVIVDVRSEEKVQAAVEKAIDHFGGIDIVVNNASAIRLTDTPSTTMKSYDLMHSVNARGTFLVSRLCLPHLKNADNAHILNLSPPLNMDGKWFRDHLAYTMAKYGMSMCVLGMADEFKEHNIAVNALWPRTSIATAAVNMLGGDALMSRSRSPKIMADAAFHILRKKSTDCSGNFFIDDALLRAEGITDLSGYSDCDEKDLQADFFV